MAWWCHIIQSYYQNSDCWIWIKNSWNVILRIFIETAWLDIFNYTDLHFEQNILFINTPLTMTSHTNFFEWRHRGMVTPQNAKDITGTLTVGFELKIHGMEFSWNCFSCLWSDAEKALQHLVNLPFLQPPIFLITG
jgi:hypothetical protein